MCSDSRKKPINMNFIDYFSPHMHIVNPQNPFDTFWVEKQGGGFFLKVPNEDSIMECLGDY